MRLLKRSIAAFVVILFAVGLFSVPASANSAQVQWSGTTSSGVIIIREECPIEVESERLIFDVKEFPQQYYYDAEDFLQYSGKVTAEYNFYNPADYTVNATLVFPFGSIPDYGYLSDPDSGERLLNTDTEKYDIMLNGVPIEKTLRHTLTYFGNQFSLEEDLSKLHDGYMNDAFYSPDMPVTRYYYRSSGVDVETYHAATAAFILSADPAKTKVLVEGQNGGKSLSDGVQIEGWVDPDDMFVVNVIGEPLEQMPEWKFYENGACEDEIDGTMTLTKTETVTLKDLAFLAYEEGSGVLEYDWYNAIVLLMKDIEWSHGALSGVDFHFDISDQLMRWYEYEIQIEPGKKVINSVTAPIYPDIDSRYDPPIYSYTYLLSPAKTWAEFGSLDIEVRTPYNMTESGPEGFERTDAGYNQHLSDLPEGELTFTLCSEANPQIPVFQRGTLTVLLPYFIFLVVPAVVIVIVVLLIRRKIRSR